MNQRILLVNSFGATVRVFGAIPKGRFFVVFLGTTGKQLRLVESLKALKRQKTRFQVVLETTYQDLQKKSASVLFNHSLVAVEDSPIEVVADPKYSQDKDYWSSAISVLILAVGAAIGFAVVTDFIQNAEEVATVEELKKPKEVTIGKKEVVLRTQSFRPVKPTVASVKKKSLKRMGALGVLGQLNKSAQKSGINLGAVQTSKGVGLGGLQGSGGVQKSLYAKGIVNAPAGDGKNIEGAGGYGTKGKGGGQAGYGKLSMIGAAGDSAVPTISRGDKDSGISDSDVAAIVNKNIGQIRFCYEKGLQNQPGMGGRVAVDWVIDGAGSVKSALVRQSSLHSSPVENCIIKKIKAWKFPLPRGGVEVKVSFPFLLKRTG